MSASFKNAELMRMGNGYFWKSLGNKTTASHCSPSFPDRNPENKVEMLQSQQSRKLPLNTLRGNDTPDQNTINEPYAKSLASELTHLCPAP